MNKVAVRYLGLTEYGKALELQKEIFGRLLEAKNTGAEQEPEILLLEHPHVYTLGKSGNDGNLLVNPDFLRSINAEYYHTERGGDITYHGYGQLVGYPILDLEKLELGLKGYIELLEQAVIDTVASYGIEAGRMEGATGVWITGNGPARKICAIGVKASRYVTMHGFALNVTTDLSYFSYINPCGFTDKGVTSIAKETGKEPPLEEVARIFAENFCRLAGLQPAWQGFTSF